MKTDIKQARREKQQSLDQEFKDSFAFKQPVSLAPSKQAISKILQGRVFVEEKHGYRVKYTLDGSGQCYAAYTRRGGRWHYNHTGVIEHATSTSRGNRRERRS